MKYVVIVDTEGGIMLEDEYKTRHYSEGLKQVDLFFAWGNKGKKLVAETGAISADRVIISGAPWFDMKEVKPLYKETMRTLREKYPRSFILFNSRLPFPNHKAMAISKELAEKEPETFAYYTRQYNNLNETVKKLAEAFPEETFVIRAHPSEDPGFYNTYFKDNRNVVVDDQYNARAWVLVSKLVLHNSCTTGLESAMLGKPVVAYQEVKQDCFDKQLPNDASICVSNFDELKEKVQHYINEPTATYTLSADQVKKIKEFFFNVDTSASDIIVENIDRLPATDFNYKPDKEYKVIKSKMDVIYKYPFLLNFLPPAKKRRLVDSKAYFKSKFKPFSLEQLLQLKETLAESNPSYKKIEIKKMAGGKDSYIFYP